MNNQDYMKELLRTQMQDLLRANNNNIQVFSDINKVDREDRNLVLFTDLIKKGESAIRLFEYLNSREAHFNDYIYFLDLSFSHRRVDVYDEVLRLAFQKFESNSHLAYYQVLFGKYKYLSNDELIENLLSSNIFRYIERGLVYKVKLLSSSIESDEVKNYFELVESTNLPKSFKSPYIEIFSHVVKTMDGKRRKNYELDANKLINLFNLYLADFKHPWYLRLFIRIYMSTLKGYDPELYKKAYNAYQHDMYDIDTAKYNLLHLFNYYNINNLEVEDTFLDESTRHSLEDHPSTLLLRSTKQNTRIRPIRKKKVGVIIAGQIRGTKNGQLNFSNSDEYEFDVFISCWEKKGFKIPYNVVTKPYYRIFDQDIVKLFSHEGVLGSHLYQRYPSIEKLLLEGSVVKDSLIKKNKWISEGTNYSIKNVRTYSEADSELNKVFKEYKLNKMSNNAFNNQLKMFYMNYCGYQTLCEEEDRLQESYEYIIKVRPDMEISIDIASIMSELEGKQAVSADVLRSYDCGDRIAVGNRIIMGQYLRMFENLSLYQNQPNTMYGCGRFRAHSPIDYQIVSSGGQVYRSKYVEHGDYLELDVVDRGLLIDGMLEDAKSRGFDDTDYRIFEAFGVEF
ncbi:MULTISPECIES: hypothetical protein [unclassified Psychrobacter]|uniref:hypothetical protein n=1 Tax=unclassified Psychrobacter TaxID=196806 RepID=UPI003F4860A5